MKRPVFVGAGYALVVAASLYLGALDSHRILAHSSRQPLKPPVEVANITLVPPTLLGGCGAPVTPWSTLAATTIDTAQRKNLLLEASLRVALRTRTIGTRTFRDAELASSPARLEVRVLLDGIPVPPKETFFGRGRRPSAPALQERIDRCLSTDPATGSVIINRNCVGADDLEAISHAMEAAQFTFAADDVRAGSHPVQLQARIALARGVSGDGLAELEAAAAIGKGSLAVEEVRLVKGL